MRFNCHNLFNKNVFHISQIPKQDLNCSLARTRKLELNVSWVGRIIGSAYTLCRHEIIGGNGGDHVDYLHVGTIWRCAT